MWEGKQGKGRTVGRGRAKEWGEDQIRNASNNPEQTIKPVASRSCTRR